MVEILCNNAVSIVERLKILKTFVREQYNCLANQLTLRSCRSNSILIRSPMLIFFSFILYQIQCYKKLHSISHCFKFITSQGHIKNQGVVQTALLKPYIGLFRSPHLALPIYAESPHRDVNVSPYIFGKSFNCGESNRSVNMQTSI